MNGYEGAEEMKKSMFYEFTDHEYYALIKVTIDLNETDCNFFSWHIAAAKVYAREVAGESSFDVLQEADPHNVTKEYAFEKFIRTTLKQDADLVESVKDFDEMENGVLLIDMALI